MIEELAIHIDKWGRIYETRKGLYGDALKHKLSQANEYGFTCRGDSLLCYYMIVVDGKPSKLQLEILAQYIIEDFHKYPRGEYQHAFLAQEWNNLVNDYYPEIKSICIELNTNLLPPTDES